MKWILPALALGLTAGCITNDGPIRILGAHGLAPVDEGATECVAEEAFRLAGSIDFAVHRSYPIEFEMESDLQVINTTTGGVTVADGSRNNFIGSEIVFHYTSTPSLTFEDESVPLHFVIEPNSKARVRLGLISSKAAAVLDGNLIAGDSIDLRVSFEIRGQLASGQKIRSNNVVFPITVYKSSFAGCAPVSTTMPFTGELLKRNGPCGLPGGLDGFPIVCCPVDPADNTKCKG